MCIFQDSFSSLPRSTPKIPLTYCESLSPACARDLIVKKIGVGIVALINLATLGFALYFIISYCPVPSQALLVSPFIVGVLGALAYMKFPTCGISSSNYTNYVNPAILVGKVMAYIFFGPLMYVMGKADWTPYHDPIRANKVSHDLKTLRFEQIAEQYGQNFDHITKYGFMHQDYEPELQSLYAEYGPIKEEIDFWKQEGLETFPVSQTAQKKIEDLNTKWTNLKEKAKHKFPFPTPPLPAYNFTKSSTKVELYVRKYCCFSTPFEVFKMLDAGT